MLLISASILFITLAPNAQVSPGNLALHGIVTASSSLENTDWGMQQLTDGNRKGGLGAKGWTSEPPGSIAKDSEWVQIDLGRDTVIERLVLCPRTDAKSANGGAPGFPVEMNIEIKPDGGQFTTVASLVAEPNPGTQPRIIDFSRKRGRYIRIHALRLGLPASYETQAYRFQLAEVEVYDLGPWPNLALRAKVTASISLQSIDWSTVLLTDGIRTLSATALGWSSDPPKPGPVNTIWVQVDLGKDTVFDEIVLFPRIKMSQVADGSPNFPVDYRLETMASDSAGVYSIIKTVVSQPDPKGLPQIFRFAARKGRYIRVFATRLGTPSSDETSSYRFQLGELEVRHTSQTSSSIQTAPMQSLLGPKVNRFIRQGESVLRIEYPGSYQLEVHNYQGIRVAGFAGHGTKEFGISPQLLELGPYLVSVKYAKGKVFHRLIPSESLPY